MSINTFSQETIVHLVLSGATTIITEIAKRYTELATIDPDENLSTWTRHNRLNDEIKALSKMLTQVQAHQPNTEMVRMVCSNGITTTKDMDV